MDYKIARKLTAGDIIKDGDGVLCTILAVEAGKKDTKKYRVEVIINEGPKAGKRKWVSLIDCEVIDLSEEE